MKRVRTGRRSAASGKASKGARGRTTRDRRPSIVALGASAAGIQSIRRVLAGIPRGTQAAVVVALHLDPEHASHLAEVLRTASPLPVREASDGMRLTAGVVHVCRPGHHIEVGRGRITLARATGRPAARPSIDRLFASVAREAAARGVAVILSGSGNDGTAGALEVRAAGGLVIAEDHTTAAHASMPDAAIHAGAVDVVVPADRIGEIIARAARGRPIEARRPALQEALDVMRDRFGTEFSGYKPSTLRRRVQSRMLASGRPTLRAYLDHLRTDPDEAARLHSALLIKVSSFLRDKSHWAQFRRVVVPALARRVAQGHDVRIWSAGCATGEEAYTAAMLILDSVPEKAWGRVKVFATDLDEQALATARQGAYPAASLRDVPRRLRDRFFAEERGLHRVRRDVQRRIIFGRHDLMADPPIAGLDLLVCRNVLIYFEDEQKKRVFERFAYALRPGGFLFLGKSEGVYALADAFETVRRAERLFRKTAAPYMAAPAPGPRPVPAAASARAIAAEVDEGRRGMAKRDAFQHLLLGSATVILVVLDQGRRVTLWNKAAEHFFAIKADAALGGGLFELVEGLPTERIGKAIKAALVHAKTTELRDAPCIVRGATRHVDLDCIPLPADATSASALLIGVDVTARHEAEARHEELLQSLRVAAAEAQAATERAQTVNEELETLNEELQSTNEEQQTLNEELQSRNEELETLNEELQSVNEELGTLNEQARHRGREMDRLNAFLGAVGAAADEMIIACDENHRVMVWGRQAGVAFRLSDAQAIGQDIFAIVPALDVPAVRSAVRGALTRRRGTIVDGALGRDGQPSIPLRVTPVHDAAKGPRGYLLSAPAGGHQDGAHFPRAVAQRLFSGMTGLLREPALLLSADGRVAAANDAATVYLGLGRRPKKGRGLHVRTFLGKGAPAALRGTGPKKALRSLEATGVRVRSAYGMVACHVDVAPLPSPADGLFVMVISPPSAA